MKKCTKCNEEKSLDNYHIDKRYGKPRSHCKSCQVEMNRNYRKRNPEKVKEQNRKDQLTFKLRHLYNCSEKELKELTDAQDGKCAICQKDRKLYIDHDHSNSRVRGLLCSQCNTAIGLFSENVEILYRAIAFLENNSGADLTGRGTVSYKHL